MKHWNRNSFLDFVLDLHLPTQNLKDKYHKSSSQIERARESVALYRKLYKKLTGKDMLLRDWHGKIVPQTPAAISKVLKNKKGLIMKIFKTPSLVEIHKLLDMCYNKKILGLIGGVSGTGKTTALRSWSAERPKSIYLEITDDTYSRKTVLIELIEALGGHAVVKTIHDLKRQAMDLISSRQIEIVLIDQANYLKPDRFNMLNAIREQTNIGFVLAGTEKLSAILKYGARTLELEQINSRIDCAVMTRKITATIVFSFLQTILSVPDTIEFREVAQEIFRKASGRGQLRTVFTIISRTKDILARNHTSEIEVVHIMKAMEYII